MQEEIKFFTWNNNVYNTTTRYEYTDADRSKIKSSKVICCSDEFEKPNNKKYWKELQLSNKALDQESLK